MQNLQQQLQALEMLKSYLINWTNHLNEISAKYTASVDAMVESVLPIQIADNYKNSFMQRNVSTLNSLVQMIEQEDLPYINRNIEALQELIQRTSAR